MTDQSAESVSQRAIRQCCLDVVEKLERKSKPRLLWHYTNTVGFKGILDDQTFHFTNIRFLNDSKEFFHCIELIREVARDYRKLHKESEALFLLDMLLEALSIVSESYIPWTFVTCFSEAKNDLSQWRAYGGDQGVSLGFDASKLSAFHSVVRLHPCLYAIDLQTKAIATAVGNLIMVFLRHGPKLSDFAECEKDADALIKTFQMCVGELTATFKHPSFAAEAEWRLIAFTPPDPFVLYHAKRESLVPYLPLSAADKFPLTEVYVGPGKHDEIVSAAAAKMLISKGFPEILPSLSNVPYRSMV